MYKNVDPIEYWLWLMYKVKQVYGYKIISSFAKTLMNKSVCDILWTKYLRTILLNKLYREELINI